MIILLAVLLVTGLSLGVYIFIKNKAEIARNASVVSDNSKYQPNISEDLSNTTISPDEQNSINSFLKETFLPNSHSNAQIHITLIAKNGDTVNLDASCGEYTNTSQTFNGLYHITLLKDKGVYTVLKCIPYKNDVTFPNAKASSELEYKLGANYYAQYVIDGKYDTSWVEGVSGGGVGQWVMLYADGVQTVSGIKIINGYTKNATTFEENYFLNKFSLEFSDGTSINVDLNDSPYAFAKNYTIDPIIIYFDKAVSTTSIKLTILQTGYIKSGVEYEDTSISEITPF